MVTISDIARAIENAESVTIFRSPKHGWQVSVQRTKASGWNVYMGRTVEAALTEALKLDGSDLV